MMAEKCPSPGAIMAEHFTNDRANSLDDGVFSNLNTSRPAPAFDPRDYQQGASHSVSRPAAGSGHALHGTVYLDMGHCTSGNPNVTDRSKVDQGFNGPGYTECQMNEQVGTKLMKDLRDAGLRVVPTWDPAHPPAPAPKQEDLARRNKTVNDDVAAHCDDSIYVSVHHDEDKSGKGGQCVFVDATRRDQSMPLARSMQEAATEVRPRNGTESCINNDTTTQNGKLVGLRGVNAIGVLVEARNVMNPRDAETMPQPKYQEQEARSLANGIINYFHQTPGVTRPKAACLQQKERE
jgi:N-acetylmuramoyl-L-alanine amidase